MEGVAGVELPRVGAEQEGAGEGHAERVVWGYGDGVGVVRAGELGGVCKGEDCGAAECGWGRGGRGVSVGSFWKGRGGLAGWGLR